MAIYMSLIPCVIAYNYFFVVEADRVNDAIQYLWTVFERLPYNRVREEAHKATRTSDRSIRNSLFVYIGSGIITGILMFIFMPDSFPLALIGLVVAFLFVAIALLIYQIEYMTMFKTVQVLSAAHLILLIICFAILPNETGYLPIIVGEAVLRTPATGCTVRLGNHPNTLSSGAAPSPGNACPHAGPADTALRARPRTHHVARSAKDTTND